LALQWRRRGRSAVLTTIFVTGKAFVFESATAALEKTGTDVKEDS
jgi:hypothetical protein